MEDDAHGGAPNFSWKPLGRSTADVFMVALLEAVALLPVPPAIRPSRHGQKLPLYRLSVALIRSASASKYHWCAVKLGDFPISNGWKLKVMAELGVNFLVVFHCSFKVIGSGQCLSRAQSRHPNFRWIAWRAFNLRATNALMMDI